MKKLLLITTITALSFGAQATTNAVLNLESANNNELHMMLEADQDVYGIQFDVLYNPNQIALSEDNINHMFSSSDSRINMSIYSKIKEPGIARVIMFDLGGQALLTADNVEKVIKLSYDVVDNYKGTSEITINNIVAAGHHGTEVTTQELLNYHVDTTNANNSFNSNIPEETEIEGNYPNPFNPTTQIKFNLNDVNQGLVQVAIYDIQGRKVSELHNGNLSAGYHNFTFDANNLASGQYFVRITAPGFSDVKPMTLLK